MIVEPFASGDSAIHKTDPRLKIVFATLFSIVTAVAQQSATLIVALVLAVIFVLAARLSIRLVLRRLIIVSGFLLLIWLILPLTYKGTPAVRLGPFTLAQPAIVLAAHVTLKSYTIVTVFMALVATMPAATLGHALERLRVPAKLVFLLLMTYRYIFVVEQEYRRLVRAAKIRGFRPGTNLHTYRTYAYFAGMLFLRASERAEQVTRAMKCRGFHGKFYCLSDLSTYSLTKSMLAVMAAGLCVLAALEWS